MIIEYQKLVNDWIKLYFTDSNSKEYDELFWAFQKMDDLVRNDPENAWKIILDILGTNDSGKIFENLSAGPLEDFLVYHGCKYIDVIEKEASKNHRFAQLLGGVWKNKINDDVWNRIQAVWDRKGWDGIPK